MTTAFRTMLAATGIVAALMAAPAMAQVSQAEQQRIARDLAEQGYSRVSFSELDRDVIVLAARDGAMQGFAYDGGSGRLVSVGSRDGGGMGGVYVESRSSDDGGGADGARGRNGGGVGQDDREPEVGGENRGDK